MIAERLADRYEIAAELGRGGMGVVYRARDPLLDRDVAVKVISVAQISSDIEARFRREAQLVGQMDHPGIVPIFDLGTHLDLLFFVMPVVEGVTLKRLIRQSSTVAQAKRQAHEARVTSESALVLDETLQIIIQVAEALDYSHSRGVVHRDVKPENIMVTWENAQPRARVMDFGLALVGASSRLTRTGKLPGTLVYLSPEQILSAEIDGRSDLYSLATILYECLTGSPPFSGARYSLLYRIAHESPPPLTSFDIDEKLSDIVLACLSKRPDERPARGLDLAVALGRYRAELDLEHRRQVFAVEGRGGVAADVTPLAGRRRETAELRRYLETAFSSGCRFVAVGGEAGMGKTRLLSHVEEVARKHGAVVLRGRFSADDVFAFQGFGDLIQDYFRSSGEASAASSAERAVDLSDLGADLVALFPALHEIGAVRAAAGEAAPTLSVEAAVEDPTRIYELIARVLTRLADGDPMLILLEQLHASEAAAEALQYVLRRLGPTPTLIVGTHRPSEIVRRHPFARLLRSIRDDPRSTTLVLEPLGEGELREMLGTLLVGSQLSDDLVARLSTVSEGNPLFVQEWVRWLLETADICRDEDGTWILSSEAAAQKEDLPETIQQAIEARLELLPDERRRVLETASILGPRFIFADLEHLAKGDVDRAVDELLRDGLLEEEARSREDFLIFTSRLVRKALYRVLPRRRRRSLHRRYAELLEVRYAGRLHRVYARLVHHFGEADIASKTLGYALELGRSALGGFGWEAAIRAARKALEFVADEARPSVLEGELRRLLASALRSEGQLDAASKEAARAFRVSDRGGFTAEAARAALVAAEIAWQGRQVEATRRWIREGRDRARLALSLPGENGETSECLSKLLTLGGTLANLGGDYARARSLRAEAEALRPAPAPELAPARTSSGGKLVVSLLAPLRRREIAASPTPEEVEVLANIYETLLRSDASGNLIPTLCREWEGSDRGKIFRFGLREAIRFSDGSPLRAIDVKRSFERALNQCGELLAPAFRALEGCAAFLSGEASHLEGLRVEGESTVIFRLRRPLPIFPALLTDIRTALVRQVEDGPPLGTGPFRWSRRPAQGVFLLERNPNDWRQRRAVLDELEFRAPGASVDLASALRSGDIDLAHELRSDDLEEILRDPHLRPGLFETTQKNVFYLLMNGRSPAARRLEVRRALLGVLDLQDVVWRSLGRFAHPATGLFPPGILGHDPGRRLRVLSRAEARALIAEARSTKEGAPPMRLRGAVHPRHLDHYGALIRVLLEEWEALGVKVDLETQPEGSYESRAAESEGLDFCFGRWDLAYDDPDNPAFEMLHSRFGRLASYLPSGVADELLERARQEVRTGHRQRFYRQIEDMLAEQRVLLPLFYGVRHGARGSHVRGLELLGSPPFVNYARLGLAARGEAGSQNSSRGLGQSGTIHVPLKVPFSSLAPEVAVVAEAAEAGRTVFETLTEIDEGAHVVPLLASELRSEKEGRRYRFRLRQNVRFHDGRKLSVRDVRYSFERLLKRGGTSAVLPLLPIRGARAVFEGVAAELSGFKVVSDRELTLDLERAVPFFPAMLSSPTTVIVPEGARTFDNNWRHGTAGTGPFRVVRFVAGHRLELEAHPHYWKHGRPRCDRLIFEMGYSSEKILSGFRSGRLAVAAHLRPEMLDGLRRDPELGAGYRESPGFSTYYLVLSSRRGILADPARRRALSSWIDAGAVVRETLGRAAVTASGLIPPGLLGQCDSTGEGTDSDRFGAEGLEAGGSNELPPERPAPDRGTREESSRGAAPEMEGDRSAFPESVQLRCALHPAFKDCYESFWHRLAESLARLGVELEVSFRDLERALSGKEEFDLVATRWVADYPDTDSFVQVLHSRDGMDGHLCGSEFLDRLIERGRYERDPAARHAVYREIQQVVEREALIIPLFHELTYRFVRPEVTGLRLRMRSPVIAYEELTLKP